MNSNDKIFVTSHVSRDFLQNAAYFSSIPKLVWEYVSNALDNPKPDEIIVVNVEISPKALRITDNGSGMSREELNNFFEMHGENIQRKKGKKVRGRFGTGKSAAFGLANRLIIDTTKDGLQNVVELTRSDLENADDGDPIPVNELVSSKNVTVEDGTTIEINDLNVKPLAQLDKTIGYLEHHLARYKNATVSVNGHLCAFQEPPLVEEFIVTSTKEVKKHFGDLKLVIKISPTPLDKEYRGVDILSYGIWHESTLAGLENKDFSSYLFGEVEVPALEDKEWPIPAFDNTRNNTLNRQNPAVVILLAWISSELDTVRRELVAEEKNRKASEQAKQLEKEAEKIAEILNDDFEQMLEDFELAKQTSKKRGKTPISPDPSKLEALLPGSGQLDTGLQQTGFEQSDGKKGKNPPGSREIPRPGPNTMDGSEKGDYSSSSPKGPTTRKGVFSIEYKNESEQSHRSRYDSETRTIVINLDHPQISSVFEASHRDVNSRQFREISYEVAGVEYALAIPYEKIRVDEFYDAADALLDTRETINRISRKFAGVLTDD